MRKEVKYIAFIFAIIIVIISPLVIGDKYTMKLPASYPIGLLILMIWFGFEVSLLIMRSMSPQILTNVGKFSIRSDDIVPLPWARKIIKKDTEGEDKKNISKSIDMTFAFTGSIHIDNFWTGPGRITDPVIIFQSIFEGIIERNYICYAIVKKYSFDQLDDGIQDILGMFPKRVNSRTPIYYGIVSHMDGSATPDNLAIELSLKKDNEEISMMKKRLVRAYKYDEMEKESKKREFIIGKPYKPLEEEP